MLILDDTFTVLLYMNLKTTRPALKASHQANVKYLANY